LITSIISTAEPPFLLQVILNPDYRQRPTVEAVEAVLSHRFLTGAILE
jgi:hypothetical protein